MRQTTSSCRFNRDISLGRTAWLIFGVVPWKALSNMCAFASCTCAAAPSPFLITGATTAVEGLSGSHLWSAEVTSQHQGKMSMNVCVKTWGVVFGGLCVRSLWACSWAPEYSSPPLLGQIPATQLDWLTVLGVVWKPHMLSKKINWTKCFTSLYHPPQNKHSPICQLITPQSSFSLV